MKTYVVLRRGAWQDSDEVQSVAQRSLEVGEEMLEDVRWIRSYILEEPGEFYGTVCIYEATSPEAIREHAARVGMPADEIRAVAETVVIRTDSETVSP